MKWNISLYLCPCFYLFLCYCLSVCYCVCLHVCLLHLSLSLSPFASLSISFSLSFSASLAPSLSLFLSFSSLSYSLSFSLSVPLSLSLSLSLCGDVLCLSHNYNLITTEKANRWQVCMPIPWAKNNSISSWSGRTQCAENIKARDMVFGIRIFGYLKKVRVKSEYTKTNLHEKNLSKTEGPDAF